MKSLSKIEMAKIVLMCEIDKISIAAFLNSKIKNIGGKS